MMGLGLKGVALSTPVFSTLVEGKLISVERGKIVVKIGTALNHFQTWNAKHCCLPPSVKVMAFCLRGLVELYSDMIGHL